VLRPTLLLRCRTAGAWLKSFVDDPKTKPGFDEETLGKLLEAAYVLQEHNRRLAPATEEHIEPLAPAQTEPIAPWEDAQKAPEQSPATIAQNDFTPTLAHIVETQRLIQTGQLSLQDAAALVAERAAGIAGASGAAVSLLEDDGVRTLAGHGASALASGSKVSLPNALSKACLRTGQIIRCNDINQEFLVDADACRRRGILALIATPIYRDGEIAGTLEVYFASAHNFAEADIHASQLTAGLITEVLTRDQQIASGAASAMEDSGADGVHCPACGHPFLPLEQFCGECGAARVTTPETASAITDPADTMWNVGRTTILPAAAAQRPAPEIEALSPAVVPQTVDTDRDTTAESIADEAASESATENSISSVALTKTGSDAWASAAEARDFLESVATPSRSGLWAFWKSHRGDVSLAAAVVLVAVVIRWGIWSSPVGASSRPSQATGHRRRMDPEAGLSLSDKLLISLGMADPPDPPEDKGNPSTQVWVDEKSGLYYCPNADSYGKTAKGKYEAQREAQFDQYEPADRRSCD
jgi:hypothetical protein